MEHVVERGLIRRSYRYIPHLCGVFFNAQKPVRWNSGARVFKQAVIERLFNGPIHKPL